MTKRFNELVGWYKKKHGRDLPMKTLGAMDKIYMKYAMSKNDPMGLKRARATWRSLNEGEMEPFLDYCCTLKSDVKVEDKKTDKERKKESDIFVAEQVEKQLEAAPVVKADNTIVKEMKAPEPVKGDYESAWKKSTYKKKKTQTTTGRQKETVSGSEGSALAFGGKQPVAHDYKYDDWEAHMMAFVRKQNDTSARKSPATVAGYGLSEEEEKFQRSADPRDSNSNPMVNMPNPFQRQRRQTETQTNRGTTGTMMTGMDDVLLNNETVDMSTATLRPQFSEGVPRQFMPTGQEQLKSDLEFDLFSVVSPGYGQGMDNKLFQQNQARERNIEGRPPMYYPRRDDGPEGGIKPTRWQWKPVISENMVVKSFKKVQDQLEDIQTLVKEVKSGQVNTLPGDVNDKRSSCGLKRPRNTPFEPVIDNIQHWTPVEEAAGIHLQQRGWKSTTNPWRTPHERQFDPMNGFSTLKKRRGLEVILP